MIVIKNEKKDNVKLIVSILLKIPLPSPTEIYIRRKNIQIIANKNVKNIGT